MTALPIAQRTKLQGLLDEGDLTFFHRHPDEHQRIRFYFRGEQIDGAGELTRYIIVSRQPDGTLTRRFQREGGAA